MSEYIDKQAFNDAIREAVRKYPNTFYNGLEVARKIAHDIDAADVQPVRRGRWMDEHLSSTSGGFYAVVRCSECRSQFPKIYKTHYCPNCGAHMTEGEQDG